MRKPRALAAVMLPVLLLAACGNYSLTLTEEQKQAVAVDGWNQTGRTDLDAEDWFEIVAAACKGAPDSEATRSSIVQEWELDRLVPTDRAGEALWIIAIQVCRDRYPEEHQLPDDHPARGGTRDVSIVDPATLSEALRGEGYSVRRAELLLSGSPFATARETIEHRYLLVTVEDHQIRVVEFPDDETAEEAGSTVSADGWGVGGGQYEWIGPPHFWRSGRIIVFYAGDNKAFLDTLNELLGSQFAGS